jgi:hypothetical protein
MRQLAGIGERELPGAVGFADRYLGEGRVLIVDAREVWGDGEVTEDGYVLVRGGLDDPTREFVIFHELAEHWVACASIPFVDHREKEAACNEIAAALLAPPGPFHAAVREYGPLKLAELAHDFRATQTSMALRVGEVEGRSVRVERPRLVRDRGPACDWTSPSCARVTITDAPQRVAIIAA